MVPAARHRLRVESGLPSSGLPSFVRPDAGLQDDHRPRHPAHLLRQDQTADCDLSDPVAQTDGTASFHAAKQRNEHHGFIRQRRYGNAREDERYLPRVLVRKSAGLELRPGGCAAIFP